MMDPVEQPDLVLPPWVYFPREEQTIDDAGVFRYRSNGRDQPAVAQLPLAHVVAVDGTVE